MEQRSTVSTKIALRVLAAIFVAQVYLAATQPISSGEAYMYDRFVRPTIRQQLAEELPNRDVLYTLLEKRSVGLFHVSPFSVRLPCLLFGILYLSSAWRLARLLLGSGRLFLVGVTLAGLLPPQWDCFATASGIGAALALQVFALRIAVEYLFYNEQVNKLYINLSGASLGLSVAAHLDFAIPAAALGLLFLAGFAMRKRWTVWVDRILIPALVVVLILLVLPLSHAHATSEPTPEVAATSCVQLQSALSVLRASAGGDRVSIGASAAAEPILNFYRAQHRVTTWGRADRSVTSGRFDYYLLSSRDAGLVERRHLIVLFQDADFVLARRSPDSM